MYPKLEKLRNPTDFYPQGRSVPNIRYPYACQRMWNRISCLCERGEYRPVQYRLRTILGGTQQLCHQCRNSSTALRPRAKCGHTISVDGMTTKCGKHWCIRYLQVWNGMDDEAIDFLTAGKAAPLSQDKCKPWHRVGDGWASTSLENATVRNDTATNDATTQ
jgi:hypothetical protein